MPKYLLLFSKVGLSTARYWIRIARVNPGDMFALVVGERPNSFSEENISRRINRGFVYGAIDPIWRSMDTGVGGYIKTFEHGQYTLFVSDVGIRMCLRLSEDQFEYFKGLDH